jgi:hypothetical protein
MGSARLSRKKLWVTGHLNPDPRFIAKDLQVWVIWIHWVGLSLFGTSPWFVIAGTNPSPTRADQ